MRSYDEEEAARLRAEPWMLDLLKVNPEYVYWGPHEDYMWKEGKDWNSRQIFATWSDFGPWRLDDLNECVNFYFSIHRASKECPTCGGDGYHPSGRMIVNTFYPHQCSELGLPSSKAWHDKITQDEVQALVDAGRLVNWTSEFIAGTGWVRKDPATIPTAEEINAAQHKRGMGSHDAINRHILTQQRMKREIGLEDHRCPECEGHGHVYTEPDAHVSITLWWLHPRKGCSRGIEISRLERSDLAAVFAFLREAASRNAARFSRLPVGGQ